MTTYKLEKQLDIAINKEGIVFDNCYLLLHDSLPNYIFSLFLGLSKIVTDLRKLISKLDQEGTGE